MNDNPPLSDLCRICNDASPKYCCPRCNTRTCSLTCYKRHQTWSQCSGKRDPGAYVKRSQLATAAGIDHDYNFLTSIERAFDSADRDVEERGMTLAGRRGNRVNPGSNIGKRLDASGAVIKKAPIGMSRQKSNKTQWIARHQCIAWTVEWVHADGRKQLGQCRENLALSEGYGHTVPQNPAKRRKMSVSGDEVASANPKRARGRKVAKDGQEVDDMIASYVMPENAVPDGREPEISNTATISNVQATTPSDVISTDSTRLMLAEVQPVPAEQPPTIPTTSDGPPATIGTESLTSATSPTSLMPSPLKHYYLHCPLTSSPLPVLIPLPATSTLSTCLNARIILEYPTIYVLDHPPSSLPDTYILEAEYKKREKRMIEELDEDERGLGIVEGTAEMMRRRKEDEREVDAVMEERRVLESLRRDVSALSGRM